MQMIEIAKLTQHPRNRELFDDIHGSKWDEFKESIQRRGVVESIVVSQDLMIVSGHQRVLAAEKLGMESVPCSIKHYPEEHPQTKASKEDQILEDLICTNLMQRGIGNLNNMKMARCINELERIYDIRHGGDRARPHNANLKTQEDLASQIGISMDQLQRYKQLMNLIPDIQNLVEKDKIKPTVAYSIIARLTEEEQEALFKKIDGQSKITSKIVEQKLKDLGINHDETLAENILLKEQLDKKKDVEDQIETALEDKRKVELDLVNLRSEKTKIEYISGGTSYKDTPETTAKVARLELEIAEKENYRQKYKDSLEELTDKNEVINKFMGENTNFQLVSKTSEITLKMMNFVKEMSQYDYLSEAFNEIPDATRREYVRSVNGVFKWAKNILQVVRHDDVSGVNTDSKFSRDIIEIKNAEVIN